jgi:hypothetical protein
MLNSLLVSPPEITKKSNIKCGRGGWQSFSNTQTFWFDCILPPPTICVGQIGCTLASTASFWKVALHLIDNNSFSSYDYSSEFLAVFDFGSNFGLDGNGNVTTGESIFSFGLYKHDDSSCEFLTSLLLSEEVLSKLPV